MIMVENMGINVSAREVYKEEILHLAAKQKSKCTVKAKFSLHGTKQGKISKPKWETKKIPRMKSHPKRQSNTTKHKIEDVNDVNKNINDSIHIKVKKQKLRKSLPVIDNTILFQSNSTECKIDPRKNNIKSDKSVKSLASGSPMKKKQNKSVPAIENGSWSLLKFEPETKHKKKGKILSGSVKSQNAEVEKSKNKKGMEFNLNEIPLHEYQLCDSEELGFQAFKWMLQPFDMDTFFRDHWEKKPLLIRRKGNNPYKSIFSTDDLNMILTNNVVCFTKNLDVTSYKNGKRETHNPEGRALPPVVWDFFNNGCSIRMLNPQTFHLPVWSLLAKLQEYFSSFCGANIYLTPPGTQGFAPHWDDIEAFILQLEGKKHWRVYGPRYPHEELPRQSSGNFGDKTQLGEPVIDTILSPGDMLYFPRGFIHQGDTPEEHHSLHITISTYQKTSWVDFMEKLLPAVLTTASESAVDYRRGLPLGYLKHLGIVQASDNESKFQKEFLSNMKTLMKKMVDDMSLSSIHSIADQMCKGFIHDALPPVVTADEKECSVFGGGERWCPVKQKVVNQVELSPDIPIRLLRKNCVRLVTEEYSCRLYSSVENSREYHAEEPACTEIDRQSCPAIEILIKSYPKFVRIESLPFEDMSMKMTFAMALWERGLVTTLEPLEMLDY